MPRQYEIVRRDRFDYRVTLTSSRNGYGEGEFIGIYPFLWAAKRAARAHSHKKDAPKPTKWELLVPIKGEVEAP